MKNTFLIFLSLIILLENKGSSKLTEYADCWILTLSGDLDIAESDTDADFISMQVKTSASEISYSGYWYYDNFHIKDRNTIYKNFDYDSELPHDFYNHGTNGSYYYWNNIGSDIYHFGFDTIDFNNR